MKTRLSRFPSLNKMNQEAVKKASARWRDSVSKDKKLTQTLIAQMHKWLQKIIGEDQAANATYDVSYDPERPYEFFGVDIWITSSCAEELYTKMKRHQGEKCFPFKLTDTSRQNTVGLLEVEVVEDKENDDPSKLYSTALQLHFCFVEW